jgi:SAM-dependent methyltransferase
MTVHKTEAGTPWSELARLDPLAAVLDPGDTIGAKNRAIDRAHKRAIGSAIGDVRGGRVIDFGCGTGRLSEWLVNKRAIVDGVDVTAEMVAAATRRNLARATFTVIGDEGLPFADSTFDVAVTAYVLQYYVQEASVAAELARVLKTGGTVAAVEQVTDSEIGRGGSLAEYRKMFLDAGFVSVKSHPIRVSDSRVLGFVQQHPRAGRLPLVSAALQYEAQRLDETPLTNGRYADVLFVART